MASVLTLAGVLAEEGSKKQLKVGCWDKELAEALKASGFIVFLEPASTSPALFFLYH